MQWEFAVEKNILLVRLVGEFDLAVADKFRDALEEALSKHDVRHMILNFTDVTYIDSSGLGVILGRYKKLTQKGGKVAIIKPQIQVRRILELSGLLNIISEYHDESEAVDKIS